MVAVNNKIKAAGLFLGIVWLLYMSKLVNTGEGTYSAAYDARRFQPKAPEWNPSGAFGTYRETTTRQARGGYSSGGGGWSSGDEWGDGGG